MYFDQPGKVNTVPTLTEAARRGQELGLDEIVLATTTGDSYLLALAAGNIYFESFGEDTGVYAEPEVLPAAAWGGELPVAARLALVALAFVVASVSTLVMEEPIRRGTFHLTGRSLRAAAPPLAAMGLAELGIRTVADLRAHSRQELQERRHRFFERVLRPPDARGQPAAVRQRNPDVLDVLDVVGHAGRRRARCGERLPAGAGGHCADARGRPRRTDPVDDHGGGSGVSLMVKICGLKDREDVEAAVKAGADGYVGQATDRPECRVADRGDPPATGFCRRQAAWLPCLSGSATAGVLAAWSAPGRPEPDR